MRLCKCVGVLCGVAVGIGMAIAGGFLTGEPALAQPGVQPVASPQKIATVDVLKIVERYIGKPELATARTDLITKWQGQIGAAQAERDAIATQARGLQPSDPKIQELSAQFQQKDADLQRMSQQAQSEVDTIVSQHMVQGYDAARTAVGAAATRGGYTLVLMSRAAAEPIKPQDQNMVIQQMLARSVVSASGVDDLTESIIADMKLPPLPQEAANPAPPPAASPAAAPPGQK
ncbi:MAG: OmpH family outer membrane protein [Phycisphaerales bacterium]|nr:OmpH family outer membrane protein [Phycisphaerales bacterium]